MFFWHTWFRLNFRQISLVQLFIPPINAPILISVQMLTAVSPKKWTQSWMYCFKRPVQTVGGMWRHVKFRFQVFPFLWLVEVIQVYLTDSVLQSHFPAYWFMSCRAILWPCACTVVCSLFMAWEVVWWVGWYQQCCRVSRGKVGVMHGVQAVNGVTHPSLHGAYIWSGHEAVT